MATGVLDRLLITLAVRLHAFAVCEIKEGWRLLFDPMEAVTIHYVLAGHGVATIGSGASVAFGPQSIIIMPPRTSQNLCGTSEVRDEARADEHCRLIDDGLVTFTAGDGSRDLLVICGTISASYGGALGLFDKLAEPIVENLAASPIIRNAFEILLAEVAAPSVGTQALAEALMKQCLILVLRQHLKRMTVTSPFFAELQDTRLARTITAVLERPAGKHSVESLAALAGMSRSSFAEHFVRTFGERPIEFVNRVRLRLGANMLSTTALPIKIIAVTVGYSSRSYFSRAFRQAYGVDPRTFRDVGGYAELEPSPVEVALSADRSGEAEA